MSNLPTAQIVAERTIKAFRDRAENCDLEDWSDAQSYRDFVTVLRSGSAWATDSQTVVATVADTTDGRIWHYVASEALDSAGQDLPDSAYIDRVSSVCWRITW